MNKNQLTENIQARIDEVAGYQVNIDNYTAILALLPAECPDRLTPYIASSIEALAETTMPFEDLEILSDLKFRKQLSARLISEKLEQRKSSLVLTVLKARMEQDYADS